MDARRFDALAPTLSLSGRRRDVLGILATLPVLGVLLGLLTGLDSTEARKRRKQGRHAHRSREVTATKKRKKRKKKKCRANSATTTCAGKCGPVRNNCQKTVDCGSCACNPPCGACFTCREAPSGPGTCVVDAVQVGGACGACATCDASGQCVAACDASQDCCGDACVDLQSDRNHCGVCDTACPSGHFCQGGVCGVACDGDFCPSATKICDDGACRACDVCATCTHTTVQSAIDSAADGTTVRICAGTYLRPGSGPVADIQDVNLTLVGAGIGATILDGGSGRASQPVLHLRQSTSAVRQLAVFRGQGASGIWIVGAATLTLAETSVSDCFSNVGAGIANEGTLTLDAGTVVSNNQAISEGLGGGIANTGESATVTLHDGARVSGNIAGFKGGGIYNLAGAVILEAGSEMFDNGALGSTGNNGLGGAIFNDGGTVTLQPGCVVCGNSNPECTGFDDGGICQDFCT